MKPKLLFFSPYFHPYTSGLTVYPYRYFSELHPDQEVTVLTFSYVSGLPKEESIQNMRIVRMPYLFRISKGFIAPQSLLYFLRYLRNHDKVIINLPSVEGLPLTILAKLMGKKVAGFFYCNVDLGDSLSQIILSKIAYLAVFVQLWLADSIIALPGYIESTDFGKQFKNKIVTPPPPAKKLPVNKKSLQKYLSEKKSTRWIGFVGRIAQEKGLEYLIGACQILKKEYPLSLRLAGPVDSVGEDKYRTKILALLKKNNLDYKIYGFLDEADLGAFYQSLDVLVLPSINSTEAYGMVQMEAMLLGTPVVASNLPGVAMPIQETGMGLLVKSKDVESLANAIDKVITQRSAFNWKQA